MFEGILNLLKENQFLSGGGLLLIFGAAMVYLRAIPRKLWSLFVRRFVATYEIRNNDDAFYWLQGWLADHPYSKKTRLVWVTTGTGNRSSRSGPVELNESGSSGKGYEEGGEQIDTRPMLFFSPAPGNHLIKHNGKWFYLDRAQKEPLAGQDTSSLSNMFQQESFTIRTFSWNAKYIRELLEEIRDHALPPSEPKVRVMVPTYEHWHIACRKLRRDINSVILQNGLMERIQEDIKEFITSREWYREMGIPHHRGYLLYGPPGSGKTSIVHAMASQLFCDVHVLSLASDMNDKKLGMLMANIDERSIVLIEDIDCVFTKRSKNTDTGVSDNVTFSGLLNALDGVTSSEGRILFMTTNHVDQLDAALIRPGRVDMKLFFDHADKDQARTLFLRFFEDKPLLAEKFADRLPEETSMAALQDLLIRHRYDPQAAVTDIVNVADYHKTGSPLEEPEEGPQEAEAAA